MNARSLFAAFLTLATGCGGTFYQPSRAWRIDPHPEAEIDDEDIERALAARPQIPAQARVAFFNMAPEHDEAIDEMLRQVPGVTGTYRIPPVLVTGQRRFDAASSPYAERQQVSMKTLRLIAARAHCDLVVVFDYGYRIERSVNGWAALNILLIPAFFTPQVDAEVESYVESYVIDVRNGYLYGQTSDDDRTEVSNMTIWSERDQRHVRRQWRRLLAATQRRLTTVVTNPDATTPSDAAPGSGSDAS